MSEPAPFRISQWKQALDYVVRGNRGRFRLCIFLGLLSNGFVSAANPLALKYLFDEGIIRRDFTRFVLIGLASVAVFTLWRVGVYFYRIYVQRLKNSIFSDLSSGLLAKFYRLPYEEILRRDQGYFVSRVYDEVATAAPLVLDTALLLSNMAVTFAVALGVAVAISPRAALLVFLAVPVLHLLARRYGGRIQHESVVEIEEEARLRGVLGRAIASYKAARIFRLEATAQGRVGEQTERFLSTFLARFKTMTRYETLPLDRISAVVAPFDFVPGSVRQNAASSGTDGRERVERLAARLGLFASLEKDPGDLSAGQRKRLEILMVLAKEADLYLLDEPFAGIDVGSKAEILRAILENTRGKTLLVILHGDEEYYHHFDRVIDLASSAGGADRIASAGSHGPRTPLEPVPLAENG